MKEFEQNNDLDNLQDDLQEDVFFEDEEGNLYSKEEYNVDADGQLYYIDDYYEDEDGNLYPKDEFVLGDDGLLYTKEEFAELAISAGATTVLSETELADELEEVSEVDMGYDEEEDDDDAAGGMFVRNGETSFFEGIFASLKEVHIMDMVIAFTGIVVLLAVVIAFLTWRNAGQVDQQVAAMATVGEELSSVTIAGNGNLVALKEAYITQINRTPTVEEENAENVEVVVNFTSIEKDLKVKFLNKETKELISGVLFKVELVNSSKTTTTLIDENRDGIIYETDLAAGTYQVKCLNVGGFEFPQTATPVTVKDKIVYQKVYIADEVKTEDDINASKEDVVVEEEVVEEKLQDTVEYVASSKKEISGDAAYAEVAKTSIADPSLISSRTSTLMAMATRMVGYTTVSGGDVKDPNTDSSSEINPDGNNGNATATVGSISLKETSISPEIGGKAVTLTAVVEPSGTEVAWSSGDETVAKVSGGTVTAVGKGNTDIIAKITVDKKEYIATCAVAVSEPETVKVTSITVAADATTLEVGGTTKASVTAVLPDNANDKTVTWSSSADDVAKVDQDGTVTGKAEGDAIITATAKDGSNVTGTAKVTVAATTQVTGVTISGDATVVEGSTITLTAAVTPSDATNQKVTWTSSDNETAIVSEKGVVTGKKAGPATITVTTEDGSKTATQKITVTAPTKYVENIEAKDITIKAGDSATLSATVTGQDGCNKNVTWELKGSSDSIKLEKETGKITAISPTKADTPVVVVATTVGKDKDGNSLKAEVKVTVTANTTIALDKSSISLKVSETYKLKTTVTNLSDKTVKYTTKDATIATVAEDGTVKGIKVGATEVYATASDGTKVTCKVTVVTNPSLDTKTELKDKNGLNVYVKEGNTYRKAVYADYYKEGIKFYLKGSTQYTYTGWQTINNKTYYYDKNGKKVTGTQVIQGVQYNFASDGSLSMGDGTLGIDVSKWNGNINWTAVKNSGVSYAIIRCGYRGYSTGVLVEDPTFRANMQGAAAAGIKIGVYFFSQAVNEVEAVQEASMVLDMVKDYRLSYPVFIDVERSGGRADSLSTSARTAVTNAFCATIQNSGYTAGVYANKDWMTNKLNMSQLTGYKIWLAQYSSKPTYSGRYDMWQYTQTGRVGGISTAVDLNKSYLGY